MKILVSLIVLMVILLPLPVVAQDSLLTINYTATPDTTSLSNSIPEEEINFNLELLDEEVEIIAARITFDQNLFISSNAILELKDEGGELLKATSAAQDERSFTSLENYLISVPNGITSLDFQIKVTGLNPNEYVLLDNIQMEIKYRILDKKAPVVSEVKVEELTDSSALLTWKTDEEAKSNIRYGKTSNYTENSNQEENFTKEHSILLLDLLPGTTYHFTIISEDKNKNVSQSSNSSFVTSRTSNENVLGADSTLIENAIQNLRSTLSFEGGEYVVRLLWDLKEGANADSFILYKKSGNATTTQVVTIDSFNTSYSDSEVTEGQEYTYILRSKEGNSVSTATQPVKLVVNQSNLTPLSSDESKIDIARLIIFVVAVSFGTMIILYFSTKRVRTLFTKVTSLSLGKNKFKDPKYMESEFEKRINSQAV